MQMDGLGWKKQVKHVISLCQIADCIADCNAKIPNKMVNSFHKAQRSGCMGMSLKPNHNNEIDAAELTFFL